MYASYNRTEQRNEHKGTVLDLLFAGLRRKRSGEEAAARDRRSRSRMESSAQLRQDGYLSPHARTRLPARACRRYPYALKLGKHLRGRAAGCDIEFFKTLSSTIRFETQGGAGEKEGKVAIAETQSAGKAFWADRSSRR